MPLHLTEADVRSLLPMSDLIDAMERALAQFSTGGVTQPLRAIIEVEPRAFFASMPAYIREPAALGTKLVTVFMGNAEAGLPTHLATIVLLDPATGELMALLDGRYITEARTAAVSAVSTRHMAQADASVLAILGSGVQAQSHLEALTFVRSFREVRVWSRTANHRDRYVHDMAPHVRVPLRAVSSAEEAVRDADVIALVTAATEPVIQSAWLKDGAHICAVGACRPDCREMDSDLVARARLIVDSRAGALAEAGDVVLPIKEGRITADHIAGELGEVVAGRVTGRTHAAEMTIFKSLGMAVEDVAAAHLAYRRACEIGLGRGVVL